MASSTMFANAAQFLLSNARAEDHPLYGSPVTYRALAGRVRSLARTIALTTPPRAHVLIEMEPTAERIAGLLAIMMAGRVAVPLDGQAQHAAARTVFKDTDPAARVGSFSQAAPEVRALAELAAAPRRERAGRRTTVHDPAIVLFTSGTTAVPKGVVLSHGNIISNTEAILEAVPLTCDDRVALVLPLIYSYGLSVLYTSLRSGAQMVPESSLLLPGEFLPRAAGERITVFPGVPRHYEKLLQIHGFGSRRLPYLRLLQCAGGRLPADSILELRARFPQARVAPMYGQTEATARLSVLDSESLAEHLRSVGRGIPGVRLSVREEAGRELEAGEQGELYAQGANVMLGYLGDEAATRAVLTPHGLRTRDLAVRDEDGFIELVGRAADFAKPGGVRVSLPAVESAAEELPHVRDAVAMRCGDSEEVSLEVTLARGSIDDVLRGLRRTLPASHVPAEILAVAEIPRTQSGKKIRWRERPAVPL